MQLSGRPNPSGASRIGAALSVLVLAVMTAGCSEPSASPARSQRSPAMDLLAAVRHSGGLCSSGTCSTDLTVYDDGRWVVRDETSGNRNGNLADNEVRELRTLVAESQVPSVAGTSACPADYDGVRVTYTIGSEPERFIDACTTLIPPTDPLIERLDALFQELSQK